MALACLRQRRILKRAWWIAALTAALLSPLFPVNQANATSGSLGLMYGGGYHKSPEDVSAVGRLGAHYWRFGMSCDETWTDLDKAVELAWKNNLTIIAYPQGCNGSRQFPVYPANPGSEKPSAQWTSWENWLYQAVHHYGVGGEFWAGKSNPRPITVWELWNEPNLGLNSPGGVANPQAYGRFLKRSAGAVREAQQQISPGALNPTVLVGGLVTKEDNADGPSVKNFLSGMFQVSNVTEKVAGLGLHPYAYGAGSLGPIENNIQTARKNLEDLGHSELPIWITEIGWPVKPESPVEAPFFPVEASEQSSMLNELLSWYEAAPQQQYLRALVYYFYRDFNWNGRWDSFTGLRKQNGEFRPAWFTFQAHTGAFNWPVPPGVQTQAATEITSSEATLRGAVAPNGLTTKYRFEFGKVEDGAYTNSIPLPDASIAYDQGTTSVNARPKGLWPATEYHYRLVVTNPYSTSYGEEVRFTTDTAPPVVVNEPALDVTPTGAMLRSQINTNGLYTSYYFGSGTNGVYYGEKTPLPPAVLPASNKFVWVGAKREDLIPGRTYHYRAFAENAKGSDNGQNVTFTTPEWSIEPTGSATGSRNRFTDVSCVSLAFCMAVAKVDAGGVSFAYAAKWNGSSWGSPLVIPNNTGLELRSVSCASASSCIAVGRRTEPNGSVVNAAAHWNGSNWSTVAPPNVEGGNNRMAAVSCPAANLCVAVANLVFGGSTFAYAETWNGTSWGEAVGIPSNAGLELHGISCFSATSCMAVGDRIEGPNNVSAASARWNGSAWSTVVTPGAGGPLNALTDVACTSASFCIAAGNEVGGGVSFGYGETWNGSAWSNPVGAPANAGLEMTSASCILASSSCMVVGTKTEPSGNTVPVAMTWNGAGWIPSIAAPTGQGPQRFDGVSCTSICRAVGSSTVGSDTVTLAETRVAAVTEKATGLQPTQVQLNGIVNPNGAPTTYRFEYGTTTTYGSQVPSTAASAGSMSGFKEVSTQLSGLTPATTYHFRLVAYNTGGSILSTRNETFTTPEWKTEPTKNNGSGNERMTDVSCVGPSFCMAVANLFSGGASFTYSEMWNGTAWSPPSPIPANTGVELESISCASSTSCVAVGKKTEANGTVVNASARWNGSGWLSLAPPNAAGNANEMTGISCTSATACVAVAKAVSGASFAYSETWNGTSWSAPIAVPANTGVDLKSISCTSSTSCLAVGNKLEANKALVNASASWNGSTWSPLAPFNAAGNANEMTGVSCTSATACVAVANAFSAASFAYSETWNGTSWSAPIAVPANTGVELLDVSCSSAASCTAVGSRSDANGSLSPAAATWNGTSWTPRLAAPVSDAGVLLGVSCVTKCRAVGFGVNSSGSSTLAEVSP
jgi:hypothetical protein